MFTYRDGWLQVNEPSNERNADSVEKILKEFTDCGYEHKDNEPIDARHGVEQDVTDLLANVVHFCHRAGLNWTGLMEQAQNMAYEDLEDSPAVVRDVSRFPDKDPATMENQQASSKMFSVVVNGSELVLYTGTRNQCHLYIDATGQRNVKVKEAT